MSKHILCIEDEASIRDMLRFSLERQGFSVSAAESGEQMPERIHEQRPNLILMDWMLPDATGPELIKRLRRDEYTRHIPIILLTAKAEEQDMIEGLESGADDYISKPVSLKSLNARIKALLRRTENLDENESLNYDSLTLNLASQTLTTNGEVIPIGITELKLLHYFMRNPDRILTRTQLLDQVWGLNHFIEERTVDVHILRLRKQLKKKSADHLIQTVRGSGYKLSK